MEILFLPINIKIQVNCKENLFHVAREHGIDLGGVCSGVKTCGKCKVLITKGNISPLTQEEINTLTKEEINKGVRLSCCFSCTVDTCVILFDTNSGINPTKFSNRDIRIKDRNSKYGVVIDIGTTQVAAKLWNLDKRHVLCSKSEVNPQSIYGMDVISRITYGSKSRKNGQKLSYLIRNCCNDIINHMVDETNIDPNDLISIVVVGNTTMIHILLDRPLEVLLKVPFTNVNYDSVECRASDLDIKGFENAIFYTLPGIHGHVGSDTLGCMIERNLHLGSGVTLLVDIGTNGEIVLAVDGKMVVCSAAAGPAFEGAGLQQGMVAKEGAINSVRIVEDKIVVDYIGIDKPGSYPTGICGTGALEAVSELLISGSIDSSGRLQAPYDKENYVTLYESGIHKVILTQKDIREIQLAKGAIYAGISLLLKYSKISVDDVDRIYLAGAFGSKANFNKILKIGLLPKVDIDIIHSIGNAALNGASKFLLGDISKNEIVDIAHNCSYLELATSEKFNEVFIDSLSFPEV